jgi:hypothetical protein
MLKQINKKVVIKFGLQHRSSLASPWWRDGWCGLVNVLINKVGYYLTTFPKDSSN